MNLDLILGNKKPRLTGPDLSQLQGYNLGNASLIASSPELLTHAAGSGGPMPSTAPHIQVPQPQAGTIPNHHLNLAQQQQPGASPTSTGYPVSTMPATSSYLPSYSMAQSSHVNSIPASTLAGAYANNHGQLQASSLQMKKDTTILGQIKEARKGSSREHHSRQAVTILKQWLFSPEHVDNPYPSKEEKLMLMAQTGLDRKQLDSWFCNARKRIWQGTSTVSSWRTQANRKSVTPKAGAVWPPPTQPTVQGAPGAALGHLPGAHGALAGHLAPGGAYNHVSPTSGACAGPPGSPSSQYGVGNGVRHEAMGHAPHQVYGAPAPHPSHAPTYGCGCGAGGSYNSASVDFHHSAHMQGGRLPQHSYLPPSGASGVLIQHLRSGMAGHATAVAQASASSTFKPSDPLQAASLGLPLQAMRESETNSAIAGLAMIAGLAAGHVTPATTTLPNGADTDADTDTADPAVAAAGTAAGTATEAATAGTPEAATAGAPAAPTAAGAPAAPAAPVGTATANVTAPAAAGEAPTGVAVKSEPQAEDSTVSAGADATPDSSAA